MSSSDELVKIKEGIRRRIERYRSRISELELILKLLDKLTSVQEAKPAAPALEREVTERVEKPLRKEALLSHEGKEYAWVSLYENKVVVNISKELNLPIDSRLVSYLKKELDRYVKEDMILADQGKIDPGKKFFYTLDEDRGVIVGVEFVDYGNEERRRDLVGKIRWILRTHLRETIKK